jgi:hypothetical protein
MPNNMALSICKPAVYGGSMTLTTCRQPRLAPGCVCSGGVLVVRTPAADQSLFSNGGREARKHQPPTASFQIEPKPSSTAGATNTQARGLSTLADGRIAVLLVFGW